MNIARIKHKLTAYHWRSDRKGNSVIAMCSCGWKSKFMRPGFKLRMKRIVCLVRGHRWDENTHESSFGPIDHDADDPDAPDPDYVWHSRQCDYCYKVELEDR